MKTTVRYSQAYVNSQRKNTEAFRFRLLHQPTFSIPRLTPII